ncbi:MAG: phosphatase PAP2 family protein [Devosia sp.]
MDKIAMFDIQKPWPLGLDRKTWPLFLVGMVAVLGVLGSIDVLASRGTIGWPDQWRAPFFFITDYGLSDWILIPSLVLMILLRLAMFPLRGVWRQACGELAAMSAFVFLGVGVPGLITTVLKRLIGRSRPDEFETVGAFSFQNFVNDWTFQSFPSGHSTTAVATAFVVGFIYPPLFPIFFVVGAVVALSRVPVGAHYPTDVFAGLVVGMLGAYLVRNLFARKGWLFTQSPDGRISLKPLDGLRRLIHRARA